MIRARSAGLTALVLIACTGKSADTPPAPDAVSEPAATPSFGHRADGPAVRFGELVVDGPRSGDVLIDVINQNIGRAQDCYAAALTTNPATSGDIALRFFVTPDGDVPDVLLANAKINDRPLQRCLIAAVKAMKFPKTGDGPGTRVTLPYVFG